MSVLRSSVAVLAPAIAVVSCGGAGRTSPQAPVAIPAATQESAADSDESRPRHTIAWTFDEKSSTRESVWLRAKNDTEVEVVKRRPGAHVIASGDVWRFETEKTQVPTISCGELGPVDTDQRESYSEAAVMLAASSGRRVEVQTAYEVEEGAVPVFADYTQDVHLIASIGPLLFVRTSSYMYACGAHGNTGASFKVFDLELRREVPILERAELIALQESGGERAQALELFRAEGDDIGFGVVKPSEIELVMSVPSLDPRQQLQLDYVFAAPACYACTRGEWISYTATKRVRAQVLPALLEGREPPELVKRFAASSKLPVVGWSEPAP